MAVFPLSQAFLPGEWVALRVFEDRYLRMLEDIQAGSLELCTVLIERGSEVGGDDVRLAHGVVLDIEQVVRGDIGAHLGCRAGRIVSIIEWTEGSVYPTALTSDQIVEPSNSSDIAHAARKLSRIISRCREIIISMDVPKEVKDQALAVCGTLLEGIHGVDSIESPEEVLWRTLWLTARLLPCGALDRYGLLGPGSLLDRSSRLETVVDHVGEVLRFGMLP